VLSFFGFRYVSVASFLDHCHSHGLVVLRRFRGVPSVLEDDETFSDRGSSWSVATLYANSPVSWPVSRRRFFVDGDRPHVDRRLARVRIDSGRRFVRV